MQVKKPARLLGAVGLVLVGFMCGCAEGPLWRTGKYVPWVKNQWAAEEKIAETIFLKRERIRAMVDSAVDEGEAAQEAATKKLLEVVKGDKIHLLKIEAVNQLPKLNTASAIEALEVAAMDTAADVRLAALRGLRIKAAARSVPVISRLCESDKNLDVRIAANRAMAAFEGPQALQTLGKSLTDNDPAIQTVAMNSLEQITGQKLDRDVNIWRDYIAANVGSPAAQTADKNSTPAAPGQFK